MRYGVSMPNAGDPKQLVDLAVSAEESGWDGFFVWDHLQLDAASRPPMHDPWVLLGAMAVRTSRVVLGPLVTPVPRRRLGKLAKEITTLDHLSDGRVVFGVGLGVPPEDEYAAFGESPRQRTHAAMLDEALPLLDTLLRGERVDHDGDHYRLHVQLTPPTLQRPRPPIWVAASLPRRPGVERARRWDGIFPIHAELGVVPASMVADLAADLGQREGYDIVAAIGRDAAPDQLAKAGATWAIDGPAGPHESFAEVRARVTAGPPR
jgi:alkanesulfonate monooxygenase SsuD/methylene tetrahydromethanopterin reductase-like flavin-dependent oxidoreductase (luciferase family)